MCFVNASCQIDHTNLAIPNFVLMCYKMNSIFQEQRNALLSIWNLLFEENAKEWISFKPALGLPVFPCYACRHM